HDLGLAADRADYIVVMQNGRVVESGEAADIMSKPQEDYTRQLLDADPGVRARAGGTSYKTSQNKETDIIFEVKNLNKTFHQGKEKTQIIANKNINFSIGHGSTVAIVGESGSGKTTAARSLLKLESPDSELVEFKQKDIRKLSRAQEKEFRKQVQPIFQDPYSSLNPMMTVRSIVREGLDHYA